MERIVKETWSRGPDSRHQHVSGWYVLSGVSETEYLPESPATGFKSEISASECDAKASGGALEAWLQVGWLAKFAVFRRSPKMAAASRNAKRIKCFSKKDFPVGPLRPKLSRDPEEPQCRVLALLNHCLKELKARPFADTW